MEILPGGDLKTPIDKGPLSLAETMRITLPILDCLEYLHRSLIIHRDIKPSSILFNELGVPKLTDLGVAKVPSKTGTIITRAGMTRPGHIVGTPRYMAPEQIMGHSVDQRSDLFAFGVLLFECLTGRIPFSGDTEFEIMRSILENSLPLPRTLNAAVPIEVEAVIIKLMAKKPQDRYQTAAEVKEALIQVSAIQPSEVSPVPLRLPRTFRRREDEAALRRPGHPALAVVKMLAGVATEVLEGLRYISVRPSPLLCGGLTCHQSCRETASQTL